MNIIEKVKEILVNFPKISEVCGTVHVEFADTEPTSYGLSSVGDCLVSQDVLGNMKRRHNFLFYAIYSSLNDYERLGNSSALLELSDWLRWQTGAEVVTKCGEMALNGEITALWAENGMLYSVPQGNALDGVQYQLQIIAEYTVYLAK